MLGYTSFKKNVGNISQHLKADKYFRTSLILYLLGVIALLGINITFRLQVQLLTFGGLIKALIDAVAILIPYWIVSKRWRWSIIIPVWACALWTCANVCHIRIFGNIIPPVIFTLPDNILSKEVISSGIVLLRWSDLPYILLPLFFSFAAFHCQHYQQKTFSKKTKVGAILISLTIVISGGLVNLFSVIRQTPYPGTNIWENQLRELKLDGLNIISRSGIINTLPVYIGEIVEYFHERKVDPAQIQQIDDYLELSTEAMSNDTVRSNIIYIIVESLNSDAIGLKIGNESVTPTIDSLLNCNGTIAFTNVISQVGLGMSADGHLILMTGLLPNPSEIYASTYGTENTFPSLPKLLNNHHNAMILADQGKLWYESDIFRNFGFTDISNISSYSSKYHNLISDEMMFLEAQHKIETLQHPFFLGLMTISMHAPFWENNMQMPIWIENASNLTNNEQKYLSCLHQFDRALGAFLKSIPDNTIIFVASDHSLPINFRDNEHHPTFFMALNTERTELCERTVGQVNLYPATLEILGLEGINGYRGLAPSALNPAVRGTINANGEVFGNPSKEAVDSLHQAFAISDLILRSDYFKGR